MTYAAATARTTAASLAFPLGGTSIATAAAQRRRSGRLLFGGAALGSTGFYAGVAAGALAAQDLTRAVTWSGLPGAMGIVGTALGASVVTTALRRVGRRSGLSIGYGLGVAGALLAVVALRTGSFPLLLLGAALFGAGHAATQLTRYVVADLHAADHRGRALGWIVWAGTIGGVAGPSLLAPAGRAAAAVGQAELAGPYAVGGIAMAVIVLVYQVSLHPDPGALALEERPEETPAPGSATAGVWRRPAVRVAIAVMVTGQVVMVWLMSMTPIHIRDAGGDLGRIGLILSAHILGMYAFAPLAGWVEDRFGSFLTITVALATLAAAAVLAASAPVGGLLMGLALFLLGVGWSLGFVAGSTLLARGLPATVRASVQGRVETAVWLSSAAASLGAGLLLDTAGYLGLSFLALVALILPATFVVRQRPRLGIAEPVLH